MTYSLPLTEASGWLEDAFILRAMAAYSELTGRVLDSIVPFAGPTFPELQAFEKTARTLIKVRDTLNSVVSNMQNSQGQRVTSRFAVYPHRVRCNLRGFLDGSLASIEGLRKLTCLDVRLQLACAMAFTCLQALEAVAVDWIERHARLYLVHLDDMLCARTIFHLKEKENSQEVCDLLDGEFY
ncbi:MAG: hypothetical protein M1829_000845 [Trizodia sp. TS-e1964]|nr:MAG: hypothetical protein M1829_000845 [Trizodia sp. TS-e1964]